MAKRKDTEPATDATPATPAIDAPAAVHPPLPIEAPNIVLDASMDAARIGPSRVEPMPSAVGASSAPAVADALAAAAEAPAVAPPQARMPRYARLAASLALAAALGAITGVAATMALSRSASQPSPDTAVADATRALKTSVARLGDELAAVKSGIDAANRSASAQLSRIAERIERAEKAQNEPAARLAKIADSLDRLERRPAAAVTPPVAAHGAADVTGSVTLVDKQQSKPPLLDGWRLRDYYAGRAVVENRAGGIYEVGPGSNLPGLGKVETIRREDGRVIIVTPKGIIATVIEPRRPPYQMPYRY